MDDIVRAIAGATRRGSDDPEWAYLYAYTIPDLEVRGYHISGAIESIASGNRDVDTICTGLDRQEKNVIVQILDLINATADIPFSSQFSFGACNAVSNKDSALLKTFLELGYPVNKPCPNLSGRSGTDAPSITLLHYAVQIGDKSCIDLIMEYKADPTMIDNDGDSPLSMAISKGYLEVATLFLQGNFDYNNCLNRLSRNGRHPLQLLFDKNDKDGHLQLVGHVFYQGVRFANMEDCWSPVMRALVACIETADDACRPNGAPIPDWEKMMTYILGMGFPPDMLLSIFTSPITALYYACSQGKPPAVRILCNHGAGVNVEGNSKGYLPIDACVISSEGNEECAIELINAGLNPDDIITVMDMTVTHTAVTPKNWLRLFDACLAKGGNLLIPCDKGTLCAVTIAQENMLEYLP